MRIYYECIKLLVKLKWECQKNKVLPLVGEPLDTFPVNEGSIGYKYSISNSYTNYRLSIVHFKSEKIIRIIKEFYWD